MTQAPATPELVERLRSSAPLPFCPYDPRSPEYRTAPNDEPCKVCGSLNEVGAPDLCRGADTRVMEQAADALEAQQARIAELEVENERLRLTMLGGEDVAGFASSLPLAQVLDSFRTYETALRDSANSAQALADRYEKALREACDLLAERTYGSPARSPGHNARLTLEAALSSQGRREGGEEPAGVYRGWKGVTQPCDVCGKSVAVNAVSPSECHCSEACGLIAYGLDKPSPDNTYLSSDNRRICRACKRKATLPASPDGPISAGGRG